MNQVWVSASTLVLFLTGCAPETYEISFTDKPQSGTMYVQLSDPNEFVVSSVGDRLRMPDGLSIAMDSADFDEKIRPLLNQKAGGITGKLVRVDASFALRKEDLVIGVVQDADGNAVEKSRRYWVVKLAEIRSAEWCQLTEE